VVIQDSERLRWSYHMPIEVGKHLLAALQAGVDEENDRKGFFSQLRPFPQRLLNGRSAVLAIVDEESRGHRD
jgi:hypothetical protein